jgi:tetrahydromethanopterin S-methyltransferase subunit G
MNREDETGFEGYSEEAPGLRRRMASQAEDAIGRIADDLLENPMINSALSGAFTAREKLAQAQQQAMGALNIPSAADVEKIARRLRSVSQRLEELEDGVERVGERIADLKAAARSPAQELAARLDRIEERLDRISEEIAAVRRPAGDTAGTAGVIGPTG